LRDLELDMPPPPRPRTGTLSAVDFTFDRTFVPLTLSDGLDGDLPVSGKTEKHVGLVDGQSWTSWGPALAQFSFDVSCSDLSERDQPR
jgi:hypothetical protein